MTCGIGIFSPESRTEGVNIAKSHGGKLAFKLSGDSQVGRFSKKIFRVVDCSGLGARQIVKIECGYAEHFSGAFRIRTGDNGRMHIHETPFVKEAVNSESQGVPYPENGIEGIGP